MGYKQLGQSNPAATSNVALYIAPAGTGVIVSTLSVVNQSTSASALVRIAIRKAAATLTAAQYILYEHYLGPAGTPSNNNEWFATLGLSLEPTDVITVYSSTANVSFVATGLENP